MSRTPPRRRPAATRALLAVAQAGQAQWFFGNLYEAVARIPDRLALQRDLAVDPGEPVTLRSLLRPGSPVRYYLPVGPITVGAAVSALAAGRRGPSAHRRWLATSAAGTVVGALSTAHIVRSINIGLFFAARPPDAAERDALLRRWYRLNTVRMVATGAAWFAAQRARSSAP